MQVTINKEEIKEIFEVINPLRKSESYHTSLKGMGGRQYTVVTTRNELEHILVTHYQRKHVYSSYESVFELLSMLHELSRDVILDGKDEISTYITLLSLVRLVKKIKEEM